ncbi:MAG: LamG domain-containing protein, partial [Deltaproteobacteria bacterium]|nr:LamG domain-containing protein [Deltaproteobacteria bacterium]MBW2537062.1 LamG domain-containing protein [Deltaproteobacteria bacterium]
TGGTATGGTGGGAGLAGGGGTAPVTYEDVVLSDGPLGFWRFGESSGAVAYDSSGHGRHADYTGNVDHDVAGALVGDPDDAVGFAGSQADVRHGYTFDDFDGTDPYTLETWFRADQYDGAYRHIFNKDFTGTNGRHNIGVFVCTGELLGFERIIASTKHQAQAPLPTVGVWTHIVGTYDGSDLKLYVDGDLIQTTADDRSQDSKPVPSYIGAKRPDLNVLFGALDEFAIYGHALPAHRVRAHYDAGMGR